MILKGLGRREKLRLGEMTQKEMTEEVSVCACYTSPCTEVITPDPHSQSCLRGLLPRESAGAETVLNSYLLNELTLETIVGGTSYLISNVFDLM